MNAEKRFRLLYVPRAMRLAEILGTGTTYANDATMAAKTNMTEAQLAGTRRVLWSIAALEFHQRAGTGINHGLSSWRMLKFGPELTKALDIERRRQQRGGRAPHTLAGHRINHEDAPVTTVTTVTPELTVQNTERIVHYTEPNAWVIRRPHVAWSRIWAAWLVVLQFAFLVYIAIMVSR